MLYNEREQGELAFPIDLINAFVGKDDKRRNYMAYTEDSISITSRITGTTTTYKFLGGVILKSTKTKEKS